MTNQEPNSKPIVEMKGITKRFPGVLALDNVDLQVAPGEVHVLLGENGAGKSTLIKILSGAFSLDEGEIFVEGQPVEINSPQDSMMRACVLFIRNSIWSGVWISLAIFS